MYTKILAAVERLAGVAHKTPVLTSVTLDEASGHQVFLKCENFQKMGAFKFRGAYNAISNLSPAEKSQGVITFSSGNHAQALALAARLLHVPTTVVVPSDAPAIKLEAAKGYGANIVFYNRETEDREALTLSLAKQHGYTVIPPFDHDDVIAGQGTAAKELMDKVFSLDYLLVPCGGGGLLSGCAVFMKHSLPACKVIGVEPALADDACRSFKSGHLQTIQAPQTIADGLRTTSLGKITFPLIQSYVDDMLTVSEEEIIQAMYFLWTRLKIVVEPSSAVALAPLLNHALPGADQRVGVIISGGNVDVRQAGELFSHLK